MVLIHFSTIKGFDWLSFPKTKNSSTMMKSLKESSVFFNSLFATPPHQSATELTTKEKGITILGLSDQLTDFRKIFNFVFRNDQIEDFKEDYHFSLISISSLIPYVKVECFALPYAEEKERFRISYLKQIDQLNLIER